MDYADFLASLPWPMLRLFAVQDPVEVAGAWIWIPVALWCVVALAYAAPGIFASPSDFWRGNEKRDEGFTTIFLLAAIWCAAWAFPSRAEKGGGGETNNPSASVDGSVKSIRLFYSDSDGHLVPFNARIKGVHP
jgi:hypothetical protein